ncbi:uncharacterized protein V6R79_016873 [Siganus canaliculatus]
MLMMVLRLLVLLLAGFTLFSDEQQSFICNTIQPGCSNVCFDAFAPVSIFRLWLYHLLLLCLPHVLFATYIMHKVLPHINSGGFYYDRSRSGSPFTLDNSMSSRELSLHKAPGHDLPRVYGSYIQVIILRIILEVVFGAGQFYLFGFSIPKSFLCYEAPCTSGVECYISRPTEKTLMLNFMLVVASLSVLLSLADLVSSMKAMVRWRRKSDVFMEEMSKGEQSSVFTATTTSEDNDALLSRQTSTSGSSKSGVRADKQPTAAESNGETTAARKTTAAKPEGGETGEPIHDKRLECKDVNVDKSPTPVSNALPTHFVLHSHLRPPLSPRPDRGPPANPRMPTPMGVKRSGQYAPAGAHSGQQSDSSECQDKKAWV